MSTFDINELWRGLGLQSEATVCWGKNKKYYASPSTSGWFFLKSFSWSKNFFFFSSPVPTHLLFWNFLFYKIFIWRFFFFFFQLVFSSEGVFIWKNNNNLQKRDFLFFMECISDVLSSFTPMRRWIIYSQSAIFIVWI